MTAYLGTCNDMCPASERACAMRQLSIFECDELNQPNERAMVKEYRRAGADQKEPPPEDLRTPQALEMTMNYLIANIVNDKRAQNPELALEWYDFLWDRFRAIRKDITQQKICDEPTTRLVEGCARFHVHCCYAMNGVADFDANMNKRSLNDCLQMLRQMYSDLRNDGIVCPNEFEFQKYDILLHLDRDPLSTYVLMKTSDHRNSKEMKFIIKLYNAHSSNDFYTFFKLLEEADYMTSCLLSLFANKMRLVGLRIITASCTSRQMTLYPAELAIQVLGLDNLEDLENFAGLLDMELQEKEERYYIVIKKDLISMLRNMEPSVSFKSMKLVECKTPPVDMGIRLLSDSTGEQQEDVELMDEEEQSELQSSTIVSSSFKQEDQKVTFIEPELSKPFKFSYQPDDVPFHKPVVRRPLKEPVSIPVIQYDYNKTSYNTNQQVSSPEVVVEHDKEKEEPEDKVQEDEPALVESSGTNVHSQVVCVVEPAAEPDVSSVISQPEEVVSDQESSSSDDPELLAQKRQRAADLMPAGKLRNSYHSPKLKVIINELPPPAKVFKNRIGTFYTNTIQDIKSKIEEESKANSNLLTLLNFFGSQ